SLILESLNLDSFELKIKIPLYFGGPLEGGKGFIIHSSDYKNDVLLNLNSKISLSSNIKIIRDIATGKGPKQCIFALGYSGWQQGQLEEEIENNNWLIIPFSEEIIFSDDNEVKWENAYRNIGFEHHSYSLFAGHS
ncbi:MAG: YqgE/AlgH family protein, partial [Alphaproteobacteria bacterium]